jgi:hypothetical protein
MWSRCLQPDGTHTSMRPGLTIAILLYAAAVLFCAIRVVGYADGDWLLVLLAFTLPWSLISVVFVWSLMHGASLWFFWLVYLGGGVANAFLIYRYAPRLYARLRHRAA